jgi:hypothetical protein
VSEADHSGIPDFARALIVDAPAPQYAERLRRFGQLVGTWQVEGKRLDEESGEWHDRRFTWVVEFVLGGLAVQDIELVEGDDGAFSTVATALRVYDPVAGVTRVSYFSPAHNEYCNLVAIGYRDGIRQDGTRNDGRPIRWNFSNLDGASYRWEGWVSNDGGTTWEINEHVTGTRIPAAK